MPLNVEPAMTALVSKLPGNEFGHNAEHSCCMLVDGFQVMWDSVNRESF